MIEQADNQLIENMTTNKEEHVHELSFSQPVIIVFLRHFGCVFCQEALNDLSEMLEKFEHEHVKLVMVHMAENEIAEKYFKKFDLKDVSHVSDTELNYYSHFGLLKAKFSQLYGLSTWIKGFSLQRQGFKTQLAKQLGDATQMPGIFALHKGEIKYTYIHKTASSKPDYDALLQICSQLNKEHNNA